MAAIVDLSNELLLIITSHLSTTDYGHLRRTCSAIEKMLFEDFAKHFFTTRQFMLTYSSLQALIDMSKHESLGPCFRKIIIGTNIVPAPGSAIPCIVPVTDEQRKYARDQYEDQQYLIHMGIDKSMLSAAFGRLINCHQIELRDYNTRYRDGTKWRSYGATHFANLSGLATEFGYSLHDGISDSDYSWIDHVFSCVLYAVVESKMSCESLMVTTRHRTLGAKAFKWPTIRKSDLEISMNQMKTFHLALRSLRTPYINDEDTESFSTLLSFMPELENLRINFDGRFHNTPIFESIQSGLASTPLQCLEIGKVYMKEAILTELVASFEQSIEKLVLFKVGLYTGLWTTLLDRLQTFPALRSVRLQWLKQSDDLVGYKKLDVLDQQPHRNMHLEDSVIYKARGWAMMRQHIDELKKRLVVQDHKFRNGSDSSDNEDENEESENNGDDEAGGGIEEHNLDAAE